MSAIVAVEPVVSSADVRVVVSCGNRASDVLHDVVEYYSVPGPRMPGLLVCGDHVRVVVGALDAPHIRQLVYIDPNWSEPRFETLNRGRLESLASDLKFEMMFLDD